MRAPLFLIYTFALGACDPLAPVLTPIIVADTFNRERSITLTPPPAAEVVSDAEIISIRVNENNDVLVEGEAVSIEGLGAKLEALRAEAPGLGVVIQAHPDAKNGVVIRVRDQVSSAEIKKVSIGIDAEE